MLVVLFFETTVCIELQYLGQKFLSYFISNIVNKKMSITLILVKKRADETLREHVTLFNVETLQVKDLDHTIVITTFINELRDRDFTKSLSKKPLKVL